MEVIRPRVGGRSARIQAAVHASVQALWSGDGRAGLTIPAIADHAGVTPSTIYRRWGDLAELLADVALQRLRPAEAPADTGSVRGDLLCWTEQYAEEMSSPVGRAMLRDLLSSGEATAGRSCRYAEDALRCIVDRAVRRGEPGFPVEEIIDGVVAPILHRILFARAAPDAALCRALVDRALGPATTPEDRGPSSEPRADAVGRDGRPKHERPG